MATIIGIRFKEAGKVYYFDPLLFEINVDDAVIVETVRGIEYGICVIAKREIPESELLYPLKPIIRIATKEDREKHQQNIEKAAQGIKIFEEKVARHSLDMKLIDCEYTFEESKIIFYFTAPGRVDFRELVKDLASVFRTRIELRQIGVRDESKIVKGLAPCGREICCGSWLGDFNPVSIKMAKDQNLSLNPIKISGLCGRLMCCLNFEHKGYEQIRVDMPHVGDTVMTEEGKGYIVDTNILKEEVKIRHIVSEHPEELSVDVTVYKKGDFTVLASKIKEESSYE